MNSIAHSNHRIARGCAALVAAALLALVPRAGSAQPAAALPSVHFSAASYTQNETGGAATIGVRLSTVSGQTVTVHYATSNGSAVAFRDYFPASGNLTFAPGKTSASFNVPIRDDVINEPDETVRLILSAPAGAALTEPLSATLTIFDNEDLTAPSTLIYVPIMRR